jgi:hypothetical protein
MLNTLNYIISHWIMVNNIKVHWFFWNQDFEKNVHLLIMMMLISTCGKTNFNNSIYSIYFQHVSTQTIIFQACNDSTLYLHAFQLFQPFQIMPTYFSLYFKFSKYLYFNKFHLTIHKFQHHIPTSENEFQLFSRNYLYFNNISTIPAYPELPVELTNWAGCWVWTGTVTLPGTVTTMEGTLHLESPTPGVSQYVQDTCMYQLVLML